MSALESLFAPRSVAVVGASRRPGTLGLQVVKNLVDGGFVGPVYPINPRADEVHGRPAFPSLVAVPHEIDMVVIVVPRDHVLPAIKDAARVGVKSIVTITAGFKEVDATGAALEARIAEVIEQHGIRMVGPNCMGLLNTDPALSLDASFASTRPPVGNVAFASQSGALGEAILATASQLGLGVSSFVSLGNKTDVKGHDLLEHWADDERTDLVLMYLESFADPGRFARAARELTRDRGKPVLVLKAGRTEHGAAAASSHTGSLAGADVAADALFRQCGVLRVDSVQGLFELGQGFAHQPLPAGRRVAILTNAGGPGILSTDAAVTAGLELAELSDETRDRLRPLLPPEASLRNPVDMIASATPEQFRECSRILLADPAVDALLPIFVAPATSDPPRTAQHLRDGLLAAWEAGHGHKPALCTFMGRHQGQAGEHYLSEAGFPVYAFPEAAARTMAAMARYADGVRPRPGDEPAALDVDRDAARAALAPALARCREPGVEETWLRWPEAMELLDAYGVPVARWAMVSTAQEAVIFAAGEAIVLKADSDTVIHRSDVGAVRVNLRTPEQIEQAHTELSALLGRFDGDHRIVAQAMVPGGVEALIGASLDPAFGPLIAFGLGGVFVEVMKDVQFRLQPLTPADARSMVEEIRGLPLLQGARGAEVMDLEPLYDALLRVSRLVEDHPEIVEMDLNPYFVRPRCHPQAAADARIKVVLRSAP